MQICRTYKAYDIVLVPFPFVDNELRQNRPVLILSSDKFFNNKVDHSIAAMITSVQHSSWPLDVKIADIESCGLSKPSIIRFKVFTMDHRLIHKKIGTLAEKDRVKIREHLALAFEDLWDFDQRD